MKHSLKITIASTRLAMLIDQTNQLKELGFQRDGHIALTFLADTVAPARLYTQRLRMALPSSKKPTLQITIPKEP